MKLDQVEAAIAAADAVRHAHEVQATRFLTNHDAPASAAAGFALVMRCGQERAWLHHMTGLLAAERDLLTASRSARAAAADKLALRRRALQRAIMQTARSPSPTASLDADTTSLTSVRIEIGLHRHRIIKDLASLYPIDPIIGRSFAFAIRGIELPNSSFDGCDDELVATALGYTAHLVYLLGFYLGVTCRYPLHPGGPRSFIEDPVTAVGNMFPLWRRPARSANHVRRFEYAVFLLNKSIEQLMNSQSLHAIDLRHTLPNLKCLLLKLES
ncbi:hypothetical protein V1514DRAFT_274802 [Lipomyces japonicus]|uniref:uncharacterized protein n=1 Tax=Lipomyces japonicus TaxID=56871 RepID=UPI0034CE33FF